MPRTNYQRGRDLEYAVRCAIPDVAKGAVVFRTAGSKTAVDLIALYRGKVFLFQVKYISRPGAGMSPKTRRMGLLTLKREVDRLTSWLGTHTQYDFVVPVVIARIRWRRLSKPVCFLETPDFWSRGLTLRNVLAQLFAHYLAT